MDVSIYKSFLIAKLSYFLRGGGGGSQEYFVGFIIKLVDYNIFVKCTN